MTTALSPARALDRLMELAPEIREGVLLGRGGRRLAGAAVLAGPAKELLAATDAPEIEVASPRGTVFASCSGELAFVVVTERSALPAVMLYDIRAVLAQTAGGDG